MGLTTGTHGVVIVHGIGDQRPGDTLADFSKALCDSLINSTVDSGQKRLTPTIELKSDVTGDPASVTIQITPPEGGQTATWECKEAFWNDAFPAPSPTQVLWWGVNQNLARQISSLLKMLTDPANEKFPNERELRKEESKKPLGGKGLGSIRLEKRSKAPVAVKSSLISVVAMVLLVPLVYVMLGLVWLLHFVPSIGPLDKVIAWMRKLDPFISSSLGDIERYVDHEIWSSNARARVGNVVIEMLRRKDINDITIVAHSMGAVVAYDALTEGGNIAQSVAALSPPERKKITLVTVGGAINRVFDLISSPDTTRAKHRAKGEIKFNDLQISKPLAAVITGKGDDKSRMALQDRFYWLDIFARRDPIPAGPLTDYVISKTGIDPVVQMKERMVINKDSMVFDHVSYWENRELVMPRIARAINGGTDYPWPEAGITSAKVSRRLRIAAQYASLSEIILFLVGIGLIAFAVLKITRTI